MQPDRNASQPSRNGVARSTVFSVAIHAILLLSIAGVFHHAPKIAPYRFPGTAQGVQLLTYYSPGSMVSGKSDIAPKVVDKQKAAAVVHAKVAPPKQEDAADVRTERGIATSGASGLGQGNITIAMQKFFPYPKPSLTTLPHGTAGDVILNAVIDEHGKIAELTLLQGLGPDIDNEVIQTVNQWVYTPATKDGIPVPSVQELHFHYERRG
jgi:protein TonB